VRRLLIFAVGVAAFLSLNGLSPPSANAATLISAYLYHPVGWGAGTAHMNCGWHANCVDGTWPDSSPTGLDWEWEGDASTQIYVRIRAYGGTSAAQPVASGKFSTPLTGCKRSQYEIFRYSDSQTVGRVLNLHSTYPGSADAPMYSSSGGANTEYGAGSMLTSGDNCPSSGPHAHQLYESSSGSIARNTAIPTEPNVIDPNPTDPWASPHEYSFGFYSNVWRDWGNKGSGANPDAQAISHDKTTGSSATAIVRRTFGDVYFRELTPPWSSWLNISTDTGANFDRAVAVNNQEGEVHVVAVASNGLMYHKKRVGGAWNGWTALPAPPGTLGFDGPVAVAFGSGIINVVGIAQGNAYFQKYQGGWLGWGGLGVPPGGGGGLQGSIAIAARPAGSIHVVAFKGVNAWVTWYNGIEWRPWGDLGAAVDGALGVDNSGAVLGNANHNDMKGVRIVALSGGNVHVRCWDNDCQIGFWQALGGSYASPLDVTNTVNETHVWARSGTNVYEKCKC